MIVPVYWPADRPDGSAVTVTVPSGVVPKVGVTDSQPDDAGVSVIGIVGPLTGQITVETRRDDRAANMEAFTESALSLFLSLLCEIESK